MNFIVLDFKRFPTPHNGLETAALLDHVVSSWHLVERLLSIIIDNALDIINRLKLFFDDLKGLHSTMFTTVEVFHVRCLSHVLNLAVRECLKLIEDQSQR